MATTSERSELAEAPKQPKKDKPNSLSYHTYKEKDKRERTDEEQPKRPKYGRFGALPPELNGVKINTDAIPVLGEAVEQMYRQKLQERVAKCQQDPMLQVFNDCVEDIMKKTKPHRKKEKKSKERERGESKEKKKKKKRSKEEDDKKAKKKKKKSEKELASLSSTVASSSRVHSSVVLASSSSKRDSNNGTLFSTPRPIHSVVQRPKPVHHRPISHGDWRDDRWQGRVPDQHYSSEQHSGRSSYTSEAWPPAAPSYSWDDGRSRPSDHRRSSDAPVEPPPAVRSDHPRGSSRRGAKSYTGYNYKDDRSRSRSRSPPERAERRPSPPKDMPEHIRWLHERWRKYDKNFFSKQEKPQEQPARSKGPTAEERRSYNAQMVEYTRERRGRGANTEPMGEGGRRFTEDKPAAAAKKFGIPYYQFRSGGEFGWNPGRMYTFKEFLLSQPEDIEDQERAVNMYNDYKLEFRKKALAEFFQAHSEDEWFLEKYHPMLRARREAFRREKVAKRLDAFMQLLVRGYMEVSIDAPCSRKIRKLMDSVIVLLEGGDEGDIACLSDLDYMLEEKREQAEEKKTAVKADDSSDDEEKAEVDPNKVPDTIGKAPGQGRTKEERMADEEEGVAPTEEALEQMQHARDYSLYVREHEGGPDMSEAPDDLEPAGLVKSTAYVGSGVFISQTQNPKPLEEMNLHKVSALFLHNIPPSVTRQELEEMCSQAHGGFLRLHPTEPDPNNKYYRDCVVSYWYNANLKKIMWKLRGTRLRGALLMVMDHREHVRRIENVDGLAADKSVVLRDIQLCKSLIEYLDKKEQLWGHAGPEEVGEADVEISRVSQCQRADKEPPKMNPLLINLDECLAYHLHQLIEGGQEDPTAPKKAESGNKVDRDDNLTRVLDRLILYLRIVHSVDYYGCKVYLTEEEQPRRIGPVSVRGEPSKIANPKRLAKYIKLFEERLKSLFPHQARLAGEHVELLGKRSADSEVEKFIRTNVISVGDGMSKCCLCYKRFTTFEFASLHMRERHTDKLEEVKWVVFCFNAYLADPNRPCSVDFTSGEVVCST